MQIISAFKFIFTAVRVLATAAVFTLIVAFAPNAYAADPEIVGSGIADQSVTEDATAAVLDVAGSFTDPDGDTLTFAATLDDGDDDNDLPSFITFSGSEFTFTPTLSSEAGVHSIKVTASDAGRSVSDTFDLTVAAVNDNPVVVTSIADLSAAEDATTTLNVSSNFSDEETVALMATAALSDGSALPGFITFTAMTGEFSFAPTLTTEAGTYSIEVTVSDGTLSISDTFTLTVTAVNDTPVVATVIADQSVTEDATPASLDVSSNFSDEETSALTLSAALADSTALPSFVTFTASTGMFSFEPTLTSEAGSYSIEVTASDGALSVSDTFDLTVAAVNDNPVVATAIASLAAPEDETTTLDVSSNFSDEETSPLTLSAALSDGSALPGFATFTASTGTFSFEPVAADIGTYSIEVTASDGALSISDTFDVTVAAVNASPVVATVIPDQSATEDATVVALDVAGSFSDPDGDTLIFAATLDDGDEDNDLPSFVTFTASTGEFSFAPTLTSEADTYSIKVTASDGALSVSDTFDLVVIAVNDNPVVATAIGDQSASEDATTTLDVSSNFSDEETSSLTLSAALSDSSALPSFATFTASTGMFSFAPTLTSEAGTYSIEVTASDGTLSISDTFTLTVAAVNDNPVVATAIADTAAPEDATTTLEVSSNFSDEETSALTLSAALSDSSALPSFVTFTASTGVFSVAPTLTSDAGTYSIEVTASDGALSISDTFDLTVTAVNDNPVVATAIGDVAAPEDATTALDVSSNFSDEETNSLTLSAALSDSSALPSFATFTASTGMFSFEPVAADIGTYSIKVTASDGVLSISDTFDVTVGAVNDTPVVVTVIPDQSATEDATAATLDVSDNFSDEETSVLTLSAALADSSALPSFVTFTASTGVFSFAPTLSSQADTYSIEVTASDGALSVSDTFDLTVHAVNDNPVVATAIADVAAPEDETTALDVSASFSDEETNSLTLSAALSDSSALPSFATFTASTGMFSFEPAAADIGTYSIEVTASDGVLSISDIFDVTVGAVNDNPVVVTAIPDFTAVEDEIATFDVSDSFSDEETSALTLSAALSDSSALPSFVTFTASTGMFSFAPTLTSEAGTYSIEVTASDGALSVSDTFDVTVHAVNDNPVVATAISDVAAPEDETTTLDVSANFSDEETNSLTLSAALSDGNALPSFVTFTASTGAFSFEPVAADIGTHSIEVTASDGVLSISDTFDVVVGAVNDNPVVATAIADTAAPEDETTTLDVSSNFTDEETSVLTLSAALSDSSALPSFITFTASTGVFSFAPTLTSEADTYSIEVTASDGALSVSDTFDLTVTAVNDNPVVATAISDVAAPEDDTTTFDVSSNFSDEETNSLTLSAALSDGNALPSFVTFTASTGAFSFEPVAADIGTHSIEVTASDGVLSISDTFDVVVGAVNDNPVVATAIADLSAPEDETTTLDVSSNFTDEETSVLTLSAALSDSSALPSFVTFTASTGVFSFAPTLTSEAGTYSIEVTASDGALSVSDTFDLTVTAVDDNPVVATAIADTAAPEDETTTLDVSSNFSDEETSTLTLSAALSDSSALPSFVTFTASTGMFSFAPTLTSEAGTYSIEVTASDGVLSISDTFDLTVAAVNDNPVVAAVIADQSATEDATAATLDVSSNFSDEETGALTLSAALADSTALPSFATFTASTGMFSFAPTLTSEAGTYSIEVTASDGTLSVSDTFTLTVAAVNDNPVVATAIADTAATEDATTTLDVSSNFSDEETGALTLSAALSDGNALPSFATFTASTGMFSVAPTLSSQAGTYSIEVTASDGALNVSDTFDLTVTPVNDSPVVVTAIADQSATEDGTTTLDVSANFSDEETSALTLSAALADGSSFPSFMSFNATTDVFTFTPYESESEDLDSSPVYEIKVTASDGALSVSDTFELTVTVVNDAPTVSGILADQAVTEDSGATTLDVSPYFEDEESSLEFSAKLADNSALPSFISLSASTGVFSFEPTLSSQAGTYSIEITATDAEASAVSDTFDLTVTAVNDAPAISAIGVQSLPEDTTASLDISSLVSDEEGDSFTLSAALSGGSALPSFVTFTASTGMFSFAPTLTSDAGTYSIEVTASDGTNANTEDFSLTVTAVDDMPVVIQTIANISLLENQTQTVSLDLYFSDEEDADSKNLGYSVTVDGSQPSSSDDATSWVSLSGYTLDLQPTKDSQAGSYALVVTATDASGQSVTDSFQVAVIMLNDAPMASVIPDQTVLEDGELTLDVSSYFSDEEGDAISLSASLSTGSSLPAWISWDGSTFIFTPENTQIGSHLIKVTAQSGTASVETQFEVTVTAVDDAPIWGDLASLTIGEGSYTAGHVVGTVVATDEDSASLTFALTGDSRLEVGSITTEGDGPYVHQAQIVVAGASAAFSSVSDAVIDLTIAAADSTSSVDSDLQLTVLQGEPPVADAGADQIVEIGQTVQLDGSASYDPQNVALAYSWVMVEGSDSVVLSSATSAQSSFTAPNEAVLLVFELTVMRAGAVNAVTHTDRIKIMVRDPMDAELNNNVSAQQAALVVADLGTSIGHRLGNSAPASIGPISQEDTDSFARFLVQNANAVNSGDLKTLMRSMSFDQSVGGVNRDDPESEGWGSIWIRVGAHDISDLGSESLAWDGSITNFQTGLDIFMGNGLMLGLIYSNSDGEFDFGEDGSARVGTYNTSMSSLHPWIGYSNSSIKVWLSVGQGDGTLEIANGLGVDAGESYSSDSSLSATQLGFSWAATGWLDLKFEQNTTDFEVQESELIELSEISTDQTRASLAFSHSFSIGDAGAALTPSLEVGIRDESTTGLTVAKSGTEMGLKFNYYSGNGLVVEGGTRTLEVDEGSYKEEGFYVLFKLDLGIQDRGWAFSIRPTYGDMQSRVRQVWDGELVDEADPQHQGYSLATQVSHPVALGTGWLLKPYAQIRSAGSVPEDVQLGAHVQLSNFLDMGIYQQRQYRGLDVEESIQLEAKLMF